MVPRITREQRMSSSSASHQISFFLSRISTSYPSPLLSQTLPSLRPSRISSLLFSTVHSPPSPSLSIPPSISSLKTDQFHRVLRLLRSHTFSHSLSLSLQTLTNHNRTGRAVNFLHKMTANFGRNYVSQENIETFRKRPRKARGIAFRLSI